MSRWILRAAIIFCGLALLSAGVLALFNLEVADRSLLVLLLWLTSTAFAAFAILFAVGTWRKWRKQRGGTS
jgi:hypothetical protein